MRVFKKRERELSSKGARCFPLKPGRSCREKQRKAQDVEVKIFLVEPKESGREAGRGGDVMVGTLGQPLRRGTPTPATGTEGALTSTG